MKTIDRYKIYDSYECDISGEWDCIGTSDNITGVKAIIKERIEDTDGECYIEI